MFGSAIESRGREHRPRRKNGSDAARTDGDHPPFRHRTPVHAFLATTKFVLPRPSCPRLKNGAQRQTATESLGQRGLGRRRRCVHGIKQLLRQVLTTTLAAEPREFLLQGRYDRRKTTMWTERIEWRHSVPPYRSNDAHRRRVRRFLGGPTQSRGTRPPRCASRYRIAA